MDQPTQFCSRCGAAVSANQQFCPNCGQRLSESAPMYPPTQKMDLPPYAADPVPPLPPETYVDRPGSRPPAAAPVPPRKRSSLPFILGGIVLLCLCSFAAIFAVTIALGGGIAGLAMLSTSTPEATATTPATDTPVPTDTPEVIPTEMSAPTEESQPVHIDIPTEAAGQKWSDNPFIDDFSSDRNWPLFNDPTQPDYTVGWTGEKYEIAVTAASTQVWAFPPTDYTPDVVEFDAILPDDYSGDVGGTFGVLCNFVDGDNYHEVELDIFNNSYSIGRVVNDERQTLTAEDWLDFNDFNTGPGASNRIVVSCTGSTIALEINGAPVISIDDPNAPFIGDTRTAITVSTYKEIDPGGFRMWFDNFIGSMTTP